MKVKKFTNLGNRIENKILDCKSNRNSLGNIIEKIVGSIADERKALVGTRFNTPANSLQSSLCNKQIENEINSSMYIY